MITTSSKCRPRNSAGRFGSPYHPTKSVHTRLQQNAFATEPSQSRRLLYTVQSQEAKTEIPAKRQRDAKGKNRENVDCRFAGRDGRRNVRVRRRADMDGENQ